MSRRAVKSLQFTDADYICVATDLLAKMMSERETLEVSNRHIALAMAAAGHDLRQRLHMLLSTVELLTLAKDEVRSAELNQRAKSLIFRLAGELEQLAVRAQRENPAAIPSVQSFVIASLLGQLRSDWEPEAADKYLRFTIEQPEYLVLSDPHLLTVILNNIVGNAVRHTAEGAVTVASTIEGQFVILTVSDTGPGISQEDLRRSFSFSSRSGRARDGMGLGLSIARKSAEILGHEFEVATPAGGGTCIRLHVPLADRCLNRDPINTACQ